jgi:hypothetical protein
VSCALTLLVRGETAARYRQAAGKIGIFDVLRKQQLQRSGQVAVGQEVGVDVEALAIPSGMA